MPSNAPYWLTVALCGIFGTSASGESAAVDRHGDSLPPGAVARLGTVRWRHPVLIGALAFSPDGLLLASSGAGVVQVWDTATGRPLPRFVGRIHAEAVEFSRDGKTILVARNDGIVQLWATTTATLLREHRPGQRLARSRSFFAPDRSVVAFCDGGDVVELVDVASGHGYPRLRDAQGAIGAAVSHDGTILATGGQSELIRLHEVATGRQIRSFTGGGGFVFALRFSPDDRILAAATGETIRLWDHAAGRVVHNLPATGSHLVFAPDGRTLAGHSGGDVILWDVRTGRELRRISGRGADVVELVFAPDGATLAVGFCGHVIELWDVKTGLARQTFPGHRGAVGCLAFAPDGGVLVSGSRDDRSLILWEMATKTAKHTCGAGEATAISATFSHDGSTLLTGDAFPIPGATEAFIRQWDVRTCKEIRRVAGQRGGIHRLVFAPDGKTFATTGEGSVRLWDAECKRLREILIEEDRIGAAFSGDGSSLLTFGSSGRLSLWHTANGTFERKLDSLGSPSSAVPFVAFLPDGKTTLSWSSRGVSIRAVESKQVERSFNTSSSAVSGRVCALSPDGKLFVESDLGPGAEALIRVWNAEDGRAMCSLAGHAGVVRALAFSADGKQLASGSDDTTVLIWEVRQFRLAYCWDELIRPGADDTARQLTVLSAEAVPFLADHLRAAAVREGSAAQQVIDLDSDDFETREKASAELQKMKNESEYILRLALADKSSPEVRRRVVTLLEELKSDANGLAALQARRTMRAVSILEAIGTTTALQALQDLSRGPAEARLTMAAKAAMQRLERKKR